MFCPSVRVRLPGTAWLLGRCPRDPSADTYIGDAVGPGGSTVGVATVGVTVIPGEGQDSFTVVRGHGGVRVTPNLPVGIEHHVGREREGLVPTPHVLSRGSVPFPGLVDISPIMFEAEFADRFEDGRRSIVGWLLWCRDEGSSTCRRLATGAGVVLPLSETMDPVVGGHGRIARRRQAVQRRKGHTHAALIPAVFTGGSVPRPLAGIWHRRHRRVDVDDVCNIRWHWARGRRKLSRGHGGGEWVKELQATREYVFEVPSGRAVGLAMLLLLLLLAAPRLLILG